MPHVQDECTAYIYSPGGVSEDSSPSHSATYPSNTSSMSATQLPASAAFPEVPALDKTYGALLIGTFLGLM